MLKDLFNLIMVLMALCIKPIVAVLLINKGLQNKNIDIFLKFLGLLCFECPLIHVEDEAQGKVEDAAQGKGSAVRTVLLKPKVQ